MPYASYLKEDRKAASSTASCERRNSSLWSFTKYISTSESFSFTSAPWTSAFKAATKFEKLYLVLLIAANAAAGIIPIVNVTTRKTLSI